MADGDPSPQFHSKGGRFISCAVKQAGEFEALSRKEVRQRYRELAGRAGAAGL